jgi:hypothetical protein
MQTWTSYPYLQMAHPYQPDYEVELISSLSQTADNTGTGLDRTAIANLYVSLKSKPLALFVGPKLTGKIAVIHWLAKTLTESDCDRFQIMAGHPWSFEKSENIALIAEAQTRLNTENLLTIIEKAWHPENAHRIYMACITRISPAEMLSFFTEISLQIVNGQIQQLGDVHFSQPIPFPPNLFIIGTMDTAAFELWDSDLLSETSVIQLTGDCDVGSVKENNISNIHEREFLSSCIRAKQAAFYRLHSIVRRVRQPLKPLLMVDTLLKAHGVAFSDSAVEDAIVYLANSWSRLGNGLFALDNSENLATALDLVFSQILLPRIFDSLWHLPDLCASLLDLFAEQFPRSYTFVTVTGQK